MASSQTKVLTEAEIDAMVTTEAKSVAKEVLKEESSSVWSAVEKFLTWIRGLVKDFLATQLGKLPVVGTWASRIGTTVSEFVFSVIGTALSFLRIVFTSKSIWNKAHESALAAWTSNESNGLLAQIYAYSKRMSSFFLEIVVQCLERAIKSHNLQVTPEDKEQIHDLLNELLP